MYKGIKDAINDIINDSEYTKEAYIYGFKVILLNFITILSALLISQVYLNHIWAGLFFLVFFIPLRTLIGGYHCKNAYTCIISFSIIFFITILLIHKINIYFMLDYMCIFFLAYILIIIFKQSLNKKCRVISLLYLMIVIFIWNQLLPNFQILIFSATFINLVLFSIKELSIKLHN